MDSKIPNIRFKGFTDAWEQRRLGEVTIYQNGKGYEDSQSSSGKFELINLNSISIDGGLKSSGKYIESADKTLLTDDLVMVLSDVGKGDLLGRVAIIPKDNYYVLNQRVALIRPKNKQQTNYLFSYINSHQRYFKLHGAGMSQLNISKGSVENFPLLLPSLPEQQQIGTFFAHLDTLISLHQRKCDQTKELKKTMLQKMFPKKGETVPEIRFPEFTDAWEQRKFEEIWKRTSDKNKDLRFKPTDILSVAKMKYSDSPKNSTDEYMKTYFILKKGDIAFEGNKSKDYSFGRFVLNDVADGIVSHVFITFEPIAPMDINFMKIYINNEEVMKHKLVKSTTKTLMMTTLNVKDINRQMLPIPNLEEQQKIGTFFKSLDNTIALHQRKCDELKEMKKTLLKNLFI